MLGLKNIGRANTLSDAHGTGKIGQEISARMNAPASLPVAPPQPDQDIYSPAALALFPEYTRESYRATFAVDAPPWDPARLYKTWFDSTVFTPQPNTLTYQTFGQDAAGAWGFQNLTLAVADAATVNLPGAITYPQYVVQQTSATRGSSGMSANYLSLASDANALLPAFAGTSIVDQGITPVFPVVYPADEPRRMWAIVLPNGNQLNVGLLLLERNASGTGSPGHWDTTADSSPGGYPVWSAEAPPRSGLDDTRPHCAMPVRALLPNERVGMQTLGILASPVIMRSDLGQAAAELAGQFTPADRQNLNEVYRILSKLGI
jgi:hypothetical protein